MNISLLMNMSGLAPSAEPSYAPNDIFWASKHLNTHVSYLVVCCGVRTSWPATRQRTVQRSISNQMENRSPIPWERQGKLLGKIKQGKLRDRDAGYDCPRQRASNVGGGPRGFKSPHGQTIHPNRITGHRNTFIVCIPYVKSSCHRNYSMTTSTVRPLS